MVAVALWGGVAVAQSRGTETSPVSFQHEVMAVLSKSGCNLGVCHGNKNGKGGFKLSLRGQEPAVDYLTLTRAETARRFDPLMPGQSLLLKKPSMQLAHEGGRRLRVGDDQYQLLLQWISQGLPSDLKTAPRLTALEVSPSRQVLHAPQAEVQLKVTATFADGSRRDVAHLAVYEPVNANLVEVSSTGLCVGQGAGETVVLVRYLDLQAPVTLAFVPDRPDIAERLPPAEHEIDRQVFAKLAELRLPPATRTTDAEFVRRVYLDVLGILPSAHEARQFVASSDPRKRDVLIDALLERPEYAEHWALKWADLLKNEEKVLDRKGVQNFQQWIRSSFAENKPLDRFARELVAARGSTYTEPAANWYRANRDPISRAEATAQVFLGVRLQCAKCHNHPFDRWTQDDYYNWAAFFARVDYKILSNNRRDRNDKHEFDGEQIVWMKDEGEVLNARTGQDATPHFLGDGPLALAKGNSEPDRLLALADWVSAPGNRRFAEVQVNRIWAQLLGRGLVEPIDDFRATNPASHPELLAALADDFVEHGFDVRRTIRNILRSRAYQLAATAGSVVDEAASEQNFAQAIEQRLPAEPLLDAICQVLGAPAEFRGYPRGMRAGQIPGIMAVRPRDMPPTSGDKFLELFGKPPRLLTCECERSQDATLGQTFQLVSGPLLNELLSHQENRLGRLLASGESVEAVIDELFWTALSRAPQDDELARLAEYVRSAENQRQAWEDIAWGILNSREFLYRR